ncbi:MAG: 3-deoxy-8-phosphooctulonate synthase [Myxococcota bacterium]|nr:3-deoxy-8-phosphooctulonate synthase [Myxococcota bacterium]
MNAAVKDLFTQKKLTLIAGPCVIESYDLCLEVAQQIKEITNDYNIPFIFKASFDKANRTSLDSFRGPGINEGLRILGEIQSQLELPILTDVHTPEQCAQAADVVDVLQIPAFLCRQTDLIEAAAKTGKPTNIKKGQFLSPQDMAHVAAKHRAFQGGPLALTERGSTFGYQNLVVDMRSLNIMRKELNLPVVFDATHSVQRPSSDNGVTGGDRELAPVLARAAAAIGIDGLFCEVHPNPDQALSDGPNSLTFDLLKETLRLVCPIDQVQRAQPST